MISELEVEGGMVSSTRRFVDSARVFDDYLGTLQRLLTFRTVLY